MSNQDSKIVDRLRKLIRLGESPDETEAQNALEHAAKIATKYHIDLASLDVSEDEGRQLGSRSSDVVLWGTRKRKYRWELAHVVARAWGCAPWTADRMTISLRQRPSDTLLRDAFKFYIDLYKERNIQPTISVKETIDGFDVVVVNIFGSASWGYSALQSCEVIKETEDTILVMFGRRDAAEGAIYVYHALLQAVDDIAKRVASGRSGINSARLGIVFRLRDRLYSAMGTVADPDEDLDPSFEDEHLSKETALVLSEARDEAERFLEDAFGKKPYGGAPKLSIRDRRSFNAGYEAAEEIEIPDPNSDRGNRLRGNRALPVGNDRRLK